MKIEDKLAISKASNQALKDENAGLRDALRSGSAENKVLAESLLEAMEWNWMDDDWPEVMHDTFKQYADKALERVSTERDCTQNGNKNG